MTTRFDIYEAWNGGLRIDIDQDNGEWVKYEDHAEAMQKLWRTADTRERMNSQTIATLRAQLEEARDFVVFGCSCLPGGSPGNEGICERCAFLEGRDDD